MFKRKGFRLVHLFIGLIAGVIVFLEALTGALWVFNEEINGFFDQELVIQPEDQPFISPSKAEQIAHDALPDRLIHGILYPNAEIAPVEVIFYEDEPEFYTSLFLNPYSGEVLLEKDQLKGFFPFILDGHLNLWLPPNIGAPLVSYGTLLFVISIVTGIILWWPKNKKARKQRFKFDWKTTTRWRRKNFDLHTVIGFYVSAFAFVFAVTGLAMALPWFTKVYYAAVGGDKQTEFIIPVNESSVQPIGKIDQLPQLLRAEYPSARDFEIHLPYADSVSIYVEVSYKDEVYYDSDYLFFDQYTLEPVSTPSIYGAMKDAAIPDHLLRMNYDLHIGAIGGLPTKIIMFLACMIVASLPVTGLLIYFGRKKKAKSA